MLAESEQLPELRKALVGAMALADALGSAFWPSGDDSNWNNSSLYEMYVMGLETESEIYVPNLGYEHHRTNEAMNIVLDDIATNVGSLGRIASLLTTIDETFEPSAVSMKYLEYCIRNLLNRDSVDQVRTWMSDEQARCQFGSYPYDRFLSWLPGYGRPDNRYYSGGDTFGHFNHNPSNWADNVLARMVDLVVVTTLASMIAEDEWHPAIPGDTDSEISGAWKFQKPKGEQTLGKGLFNEHSIVVLVAANGSGKTFAMERDFGARIARQALGWVPAEQPNEFELHTSFTMLGRCNSRGIGNHGALVNEFRRWKEALRHIGKKPVFYLDEAMSTTSPLWQAALNLAFARYVQENGGLVCLATHNEHVASMLKKLKDAGLYSFTNDPDNPYQMVEGVADSGFIDVVRSRGLGEDYAGLMEDYLDGSLKISYTPDYPAVPESGYDQTKREEMMERDGGLAYMFPETPHSPAYVPLSKDSDLLSGMSSEQRQLLCNSDPVEFRELIERRRTIEVLAGYGELDDLVDDLNLLGVNLETFLKIVGNKDPSVLLQQLNPIWAFNFQHGFGHKITDEVTPSLSKNGHFNLDGDASYYPIVRDISLAAKALAYVELLELLGFGDFTKLRDSLSFLSSQIDKLRSAHEQELQLYDNSQNRRQYYFLKGINKQHTDKIQERLRQAARLASTAIRKIDFKGSSLEKFWLRDDLKPILEVLAQPETTFDSNQHAYVTGESERQENPNSELISTSIKMGSGIGKLIELMQSEPTIMDALERLEQHRDQIDSVHMRQGILHLQNLVNNRTATPSETVDDSNSTDAWHSDYSPLTKKQRPENPFWQEEPREIAEAIDRLLYLGDLAKRVSSGEYALAKFNDTGEVRLDSVKDIGHGSRHQPFDYSIRSDQAGVTLSGEHSAGKTYGTRHITNAILLAMKMGVVPASYGNLPYFERISYISRIAQEMDVEASAGQHEVDVWADHHRIISGARTAITFADEIGSSTSPKYQAAFAAATLAANAARGHRLVVTTHHDGFLDFAEEASDLGVQGIVLTESGDQIERTIVDGEKVISNPLSFAEKVGLPPQLIRYAREYHDKLTARRR
ncbi:hypothetical protein FWD20_00175 [Candidatus Saccharibacteria bacterium]|nr:hypothetical protein [Candidatus Saccharibacteria bacterium]